MERTKTRLLCIFLLSVILNQLATKFVLAEDLAANRTVCIESVLEGEGFTRSTAYGTGFVINQSGYLLTAGHVIPQLLRNVLDNKRDDKTHVWIEGILKSNVTFKGRMGSADAPEFDMTFIARHRRLDLLLLKIEGGGPPFSHYCLADIDKIARGGKLSVTGFPLGSPRELKSVESNLPVILTSESSEGQSDIGLAQGYSGSPVVWSDSNGLAVVGLVITSDPQARADFPDGSFDFIPAWTIKAWFSALGVFDPPVCDLSGHRIISHEEMIRRTLRTALMVRWYAANDPSKVDTSQKVEELAFKELDLSQIEGVDQVLETMMGITTPLHTRKYEMKFHELPENIEIPNISFECSDVRWNASLLAFYLHGDTRLVEMIHNPEIKSEHYDNKIARIQAALFLAHSCQDIPDLGKVSSTRKFYQNLTYALSKESDFLASFAIIRAIHWGLKKKYQGGVISDSDIAKLRELLERFSEELNIETDVNFLPGPCEKNDNPRLCQMLYDLKLYGVPRRQLSAELKEDPDAIEFEGRDLNANFVRDVVYETMDLLGSPTN
ncbi:serine protease [Bremerella sp. JC770]|uniref:S1 family peptidase n=1 Tax=Bremerella sp. JC770 TaxID=3232137 RepID=UPI00345797FA